MGNVVSFFGDGLKNLMSRLGTGNDKMSYSQYTFTPISDVDLESAYRGAWLPRKIVEIPAMDSVRRWRAWQAPADEIGAIEAEEKRLGLKGKVLEARIKARLFGGAAIYIGTADQDVSLPLEADSAAKADIKFLTVLSKADVTPGQLEDDPREPGYGKPRYYTMGHSVDVHPSRLVLFKGNTIPDQYLADVEGAAWGDSVLQAVYDQIRQADSTSANLASLVFEAKVDVFKIPNFMRNLGDDEYQKKVQERVRLANLAKGNLAALLMDKDEEHEQKIINFSGLNDILMSFMQLCSGAADIPITRLLGQSPGGLQSTGESDLKNYYDRVSSEQELEITPAMELLDRLLIRSALGDNRDDIFYVWNSLWQTSETERSENAKRAAETIKTIAESGLVPEEPLSAASVNLLTETGAMPGLEAAVEEWKLSGGEEEEPDEAERAAALGVGEEEEERGDNFDDAQPRSLYVARKVLNAEAILAWAREQGIANLFPAEELHVTIAHSKTPVDWIKIGEAWDHDNDGHMTVAAGGPRVVERLGASQQYVALLFSSTKLSWRHEDIKEAGAVWDWPDYNPHITLSAEHEGSVEGIEPYRGPIELGPEIFEEVKEDA